MNSDGPTTSMPTTVRRYSSWSSTAGTGRWPPGQQLLGAVQVGHDRVQQLGALHDPGLQRRPLALVQHQRQRVQPPGHRLGERRGAALRSGRSAKETVDAGPGV